MFCELIYSSYTVILCLRIIIIIIIILLYSISSPHNAGYIFSVTKGLLLLLLSPLLTCLLTHSMKQSPSWEANRFSASQEIPHI